MLSEILLHLPAVCKVKTTNIGEVTPLILLHLPAVCKAQTTY